MDGPKSVDAPKSDSGSAVSSHMPLCSVPHLILEVVLYCDYGTRTTLWQMSEVTSTVTKSFAMESRRELASLSLPFAVSRPLKVPTIRCRNEQLPQILAETGHAFIAILPQCVLYFGRAKKNQWLVAKFSDGVHAAVFGWKPPAEGCEQRPIRDAIEHKPTAELSQIWQTSVGDFSVLTMAKSGDTIAVGTEECMALLNAHTGAVVTITDKLNGTHVAFLDKRRVVGVMEDEETGELVLHVFTANTLTKTVPLPTEADSIASVKASANGKRLYVVDMENNQLLVYYTRIWLLSARIPFCGEPLGECDIAANGLLAQGIEHEEDDSYHIEVIETNTRCITQTIRTKHTDGIYQVVFSPDSSRIVSVSEDKSVQLFDAITGQIIGEPRVAHSDWVYSVCFLTDALFVTVSEDKSLVLWHCDSQPAIARIEDAHSTDIVSVLRLSTDSFVTGDSDGTVKKWKLEFK